MSPDFEEGDFVVIATNPFFLRHLKVGDIIVFRDPEYGTIIKRIHRFLENGAVFVLGNNSNSLDSRSLGGILPSQIKGKVIWRISQNHN